MSWYTYSQSSTFLSRLLLSGNGCVESWILFEVCFGYFSLRVAKVIFKPNSLDQTKILVFWSWEMFKSFNSRYYQDVTRRVLVVACPPKARDSILWNRFHLKHFAPFCHICRDCLTITQKSRSKMTGLLSSWQRHDTLPKNSLLRKNPKRLTIPKFTRFPTNFTKFLAHLGREWTTCIDFLSHFCWKYPKSGG